MRTTDLLRQLRSTRVRAALSLGVVLAVGATGTFAYWSDSASIAGVSIVSGSIDLKLNTGAVGASDVDAVSGYDALDLTGMVPGNSVAAILTVKNAGNSPFKWRLDATATNAPAANNLAGALTYAVYSTTASAVSGSGSAKTCPGTLITSGTGLNSTWLSAANSRLLSNVTGANADKICIQIALPSAANQALENTTTEVSLNFTGDQLS